MAPRLRAAKTATAGDVPAVDRALDILERLREADRGQTLSELSAALHLPKNAVFRITQTLLARGYLARDPATMRFELTRRLLELGQPRIGRVPLVDAALEPMRTLRDLTRETVQLGVCIDSCSAPWPGRSVRSRRCRPSRSSRESRPPPPACSCLTAAR